MLPQPEPQPATPELARSLSFSLGTALLWLGHDCPGTCPPTITNARAAIWFLRLPDRMIATWTKTLVDVDFDDRPWPDAERHDLLAQLNHCVGADHMRVRERTDAQRAAFIQALDRRRSDSVRHHLIMAAAHHPVLTIATQ
jgi:hypothetical protein